MKRTLAIVLALVMCLLTTAIAEEKIIIGATGLQEDQFTQVLISGYEDAAAELGIEIIDEETVKSWLEKGTVV